jgi:hypothetical protein
VNIQKVNGNAARIYQAGLVIAALILFAETRSAFAQEVPDTGPQTWEMRCRGGRMGFSDHLVRQGPRKGKREVTVVFAAGTQPSGDRLPTTLSPGYCSWVDRGLSPGEPTQIHLLMTTEDEERMVRLLQFTDRFWTFQVYNTNRGYFSGGRNSEWAPYR